jgi:Cu-Zn family superoxide dismutase
MGKKDFFVTSTAIFFTGLMFLAGCAGEQQGEQEKQKSTVTQAVAVLHPTVQNTARGVVIFRKVGDAVQVTAQMEGLSPGKHGFHIHEYGDCSAADATSAGGHFNPEGMPHGAPKDEKRHVGDLGNIEAGSDGKGGLEMVDTLIAFEGPHSIIGRAVVVHAGEDDFTSQPTGNAGSRISCGVIGIAKAGE